MTTDPSTEHDDTFPLDGAPDAAMDTAIDQAAARAAESPTADAGHLRQDLEEARGRLLRTQADLENLRKRSRRELDDERRYANLPLLTDLLPVMDNVGRAIQAAEKSAEAGALLEGVKLVAQQLERVLERYRCTRIAALEAPFDPHLHQAIMQQPSADHPPGTVLVVAQDGYQLHDRVLRPVQVIVSSPA